ncbi:type II toxin-antitoxin system RelE/ParE family toxin [methane-oxidizing endosymbiont of Gigantopelta aegis]|uniref:type II toxin-antitoxin system RelE/ParE family toxin n=1 Tax=methane-oxidizing endosymbiont of Gigantopelta aegis TaxID=2794938 RepID=UPI0018DE1FFC|nr:type II toxin-antitoxin system RelE/ParE family toxin [methane-oxidizing endosymbiont of Gigantopelta aegis]
MKLIWSPLAIERVSEIAEYIAWDKPAAAEKWVNKIFRLVEILSKFPERGCIVPEIKNNNFREIIWGNYRIIYKLEKSTILILMVRHGRQVLPVEEINE